TLVGILANAMSAAHKAGIIHRDLKPANILLQEVPTTGSMPTILVIQQSAVLPRITDFGLAKLLDDNTPTESLTNSRDVVGTPSYMAPEQARGGRGAVGPAADIYALGALLYELLAGRPPFIGESAMETLLLVLHEEPISVDRVCPSVPRDLAT